MFRHWKRKLKNLNQLNGDEMASMTEDEQFVHHIVTEMLKPLQEEMERMSKILNNLAGPKLESTDKTEEPEDSDDISRCCSCGYTWITGQHGGHSCSTQLREYLTQIHHIVKEMDEIGVDRDSGFFADSFADVLKITSLVKD